MPKEEVLLTEDVQPELITPQPSNYPPNIQRVRSRRDDRYDRIASEDWQHAGSDRPATNGFDDRMSYTASYYDTEYSQGRGSTYTSGTFDSRSEALDMRVFRESAAGDYSAPEAYGTPVELDQYTNSACRGRRRYIDHSEEDQPRITYVDDHPYGRSPARNYDRYADH
ncbi:uncharacterized protein AB675_8869 [Cyphellophora attinorum]|uniref:Uncharacterized protein n=1 Tax=Cyphellophora attinorum TaxID=1664694 RepID=A0A0N1GYX9_9EURO|nr:uncharacterized protein AB675_8869 [Phialophora attinorum]KPI36150.1 hypothetical protein AB675_8869 [Phialophora attinorum]